MHGALWRDGHDESRIRAGSRSCARGGLAPDVSPQRSHGQRPPPSKATHRQPLILCAPPPPPLGAAGGVPRRAQGRRQRAAVAAGRARPAHLRAELVPRRAGAAGHGQHRQGGQAVGRAGGPARAAGVAGPPGESSCFFAHSSLRWRAVRTARLSGPHEVSRKVIPHTQDPGRHAALSLQIGPARRSARCSRWPSAPTRRTC